jgi:hypothetical protein
MNKRVRLAPNPAHLAATFSITENTDGRKLANALRKLVVPDNPALVQQIIALESELSKLEKDIASIASV